MCGNGVRTGREHLGQHGHFQPGARKLQRFFSQPFFVAEQFTGFKGKYVQIADTIRGFKEVAEGKHDALPEQAFYMVEKAEEMKTS